CGAGGLPDCRRFAVAAWIAERRRKHCAYRPLERSVQARHRTPTGKMPVLLVIERRLHGVTITRGGPHRKTQRVERSVRSRSAFCRHVTFFRADFLYAEGYTVVVLV